LTHSNSDQLRALLDRLGVDVSLGHHHAYIGLLLERRLTQHEWEIAFEFWVFTLKAHFDAAMLGLTRLLDRDRRTVSLVKLLSVMESNAGRFAEMKAADVRGELIPSVREEIEKLRIMIEPLKERRDQMLAHNQLQTRLADRGSKIAWADMEAAHSHALKLVNRVYKAYKGQEAMLMFGAKESTVSEQLSRILHNR
jgi:hypothetical protein